MEKHNLLLSKNAQTVIDKIFIRGTKRICAITDRQWPKNARPARAYAMRTASCGDARETTMFRPNHHFLANRLLEMRFDQLRCSMTPEVRNDVELLNKLAIWNNDVCNFMFLCSAVLIISTIESHASAPRYRMSRLALCRARPIWRIDDW